MLAVVARALDPEVTGIKQFAVWLAKSGIRNPANQAAAKGHFRVWHGLLTSFPAPRIFARPRLILSY